MARPRNPAPAAARGRRGRARGGGPGRDAEAPPRPARPDRYTRDLEARLEEVATQVRNIALVTTAVANGDLSQKITVEARGEVLELKNTVNAMVDGLRAFAREVTRVAREVGTEGKLGGQARVAGLAGTWQDLTDNVNLMASNLTNQVRGIVTVVTAVADGDLTQRLVVDAKGEIAALADTINNMTGTLRLFADQVTSVAREVGIEGRLGGQAHVPGAAGTWRDLTDNVNQLAGNLTAQVRAISEVAGAVTKGDLTGTIDVRARGEVLALKDTINQMIANLRDTTRANREQDWLKTNLAKFTQMMQGQRSLATLAQLIMSELTPLVSAQQGTFFVADGDGPHGAVRLRLLSSYAYERGPRLSRVYVLGEGLVGQCALEKKTILVEDVPADYTQIGSSLGSAVPRAILLLPILFEGHIRGVIELASFGAFGPVHINLLEQLSLSIGVVFNMISASTSLEEKAEQLALMSKYKSEFLANMSHELRTPLNSLLILAQMLADNAEGHLDARQVEYARTIFAAGNDLLGLISQILDLAKIEAGKMLVDCQPVALDALCADVARSCAPLGKQRKIGFSVICEPGCPAHLMTDGQRLQQILNNLLSNAFKFTEQGEVTLRIGVDRAARGAYQNPLLQRAAGVLMMEVTDTGIGIDADKQQLIFEAFQQADASTSRTYGGTGLGLNISRELARLLGGEIHLESAPQRGSRFTLVLPLAAARAEAGPAGARPSAAKLPAPPHDAAAAAPPEGAAPELAGRAVLLIDDDVRNLFAITSLLERSGLRVLPASSGREGLELLAAHADVDLVLLDIMMPEMDGYQVARRIREQARYAELPMIALTAKAMPGDRKKCIDAGCDAFLAKPVDGGALLHGISRALGAAAAVPGPAK